MKAAQISAYGGKDVLQVTENAPKPEIGSKEILVAVHAAGVNPFDWKVREGYVRQMAELPFPATLGGDFAGTVAEVGSDVSDFVIGDEVYGQAGALSGHGSFAEFVPVKASSAARKPQKLDFVHAAAVPLTAVSAYQALVEHLGVQPGQKVLIHGGAGGIGTMAIQLAKHLGTYVATTATGEGIAYAKHLGADDVIDYTTDDFAAKLHDFDAVYDTVGGDTFTRSYEVLKPGGKIISMVEQPDEELGRQYDVTAIYQGTKVTTAKLTEIATLVDEGVLAVHIDKVFPLDQAAEALEYLRQGKHLGKVVLYVKPSE